MICCPGRVAAAAAATAVWLSPLAGPAYAQDASSDSWTATPKIAAVAWHPELAQHGDQAVIAYPDFSTQEQPRVITAYRQSAIGPWTGRVDHGVGRRVRLQAGASGVTALAWVGQTSAGTEAIQLRQLPSGGTTWSAPSLVASLPAGHVTEDFRIAVSDTGAVSVAWASRTKAGAIQPLHVRTMTADGAWTSTSELELVSGLVLQLTAGAGESLTVSWLAGCEPVSQQRASSASPWMRAYHRVPAQVGTTWCEASYDAPTLTSASGTTLIVWCMYEGNDQNPSTAGRRLWVTSRAADGSWQPPFALAFTPDRNFVYEPSLTLGTDGGFLLVAGERVTATTRRVLAYEFDASGAVVSSGVVRDESPSTDAFKAAGTASGAAAVVFEQAASPTASTVTLMARRRSVGTSGWSAAALLTDSAEQLDGGPGAFWSAGGRNRPAIALNSAGGAIAAWKEAAGIAAAATMDWSPGTPPDGSADVPAVSLSPGIIAAGETTTVTYRGTPGATIDILSRTQPATEFSRIGQVTLDSAGVGTSTHRPQKNTRVTARTTAGEVSAYAPLVQVRSVASFNTNRVGTRTYTFTGRVYPALSNRLVNIYRNGSLVAQARCDATGIYKVTRTLGAGTFTFQARTPNDQSNLGTNSPTRSVRIY